MSFTGIMLERLSVVQFCRARPWTSLSPLASCCTPDNPPRYCGISAAALEDVHDQIKLLG